MMPGPSSSRPPKARASEEAPARLQQFRCCGVPALVASEQWEDGVDAPMVPRDLQRRLPSFPDLWQGGGVSAAEAAAYEERALNGALEVVSTSCSTEAAIGHQGGPSSLQQRL